jgi:hypothetical protein
MDGVSIVHATSCIYYAEVSKPLSQSRVECPISPQKSPCSGIPGCAFAPCSAVCLRFTCRPRVRFGTGFRRFAPRANSVSQWRLNDPDKSTTKWSVGYLYDLLDQRMTLTGGRQGPALLCLNHLPVVPNLRWRVNLAQKNRFAAFGGGRGQRAEDGGQDPYSRLLATRYPRSSFQFQGLYP